MQSLFCCSCLHGLLPGKKPVPMIGAHVRCGHADMSEPLCKHEWKTLHSSYALLSVSSPCEQTENAKLILVNVFLCHCKLFLTLGRQKHGCFLGYSQLPWVLILKSLLCHSGSVPLQVIGALEPWERMGKTLCTQAASLQKRISICLILN
jgi:hypothetical protein